MVDTLKFSLWDFERDLIAEISPNLERVTQHTATNGEYYIYGSVPQILDDFNNENMLQVQVYKNRLILTKGSLTKWYVSNNIQTLSKQQIFDALNGLQEKIGVSIQDAKITRLDIGVTLKVEEIPQLYFENMGNMRVTNKQQYSNTSILYKQIKQEFAFYDKLAEYRDKRKEIPPQVADYNLLRYEHRYKNIKAILGRELTIKDLYNDEIITLLFDKWQQGFEAISKTNNIIFDVMNNNIDFELLGTLAILDKVGGESEFYRLLKLKQKAGHIDRHRAHRWREKAKKAIEEYRGIEGSNPIMKELAEKILNSKRYFK